MRRFTALDAAALSRAYRKLEFDSFDRVVAEKSRHVLSVRASFAGSTSAVGKDCGRR